MSKKQSKKDSVNELPFEEAMARLEGIVRELEDGQLGLNDSLQRFEEGVRCLKRCHTALEDAERKIEMLCDVNEDGTVQIRSLEQDEMTLEEKAESRSKRRTHNPSQESNDDDSMLF